MRFRIEGLTVVFVLGVSGMSHAAPPTQVDSPCTGDAVAVGWLGITRFEGECTYEIPGDDRVWRFCSEPRIAAVDPNGPSHGKLRVGDVLFAIDSDHITTQSAAHKFSNARPGVPIQVTVKRGGDTKNMRIVPQRRCSDDLRIVALQQELTSASRRIPGRAQSEPDAGLPELLSLAHLDDVLDLPPRGHFGIGLRCSDCNISRDEKGGPRVWHFASAPEIYSIESGSPAERAGVERGDILTHVDGVRIVTADGARRFGLARPGDRVEWTVRRRGESKKIGIVAVERVVSRRKSASARREVDAESLRALVHKLRDSHDLDKARDQLDRLEELARKLADSDVVSRLVIVPSDEQEPTGKSHLRYAGSVGDSEVEVRGASPVVVTEEAGGEALTINAGDTTIRIRRKAY